MPGKGPLGEAWLLSDRDEYPSRVSEGPLKGNTLSLLIKQSPEFILGKLAPRFQRFPLLLKYLDVSDMLSVQVHPSEAHANLIPKGEQAKSEAWVVLQATSDSRIFAGLKPGATLEKLRTLSMATVDDVLPSFTPHVGESILIEAGVVHSLGDGVVVLEVQQNSDVTFRLYDWDHIDRKTGQKRPLQIEEALSCVDLAQGVVKPARPAVGLKHSVLRERLVDCPHFRLCRLTSTDSLEVGEDDAPTVVVCIEGKGNLEYQGQDFTMIKGSVVLLPAAVGRCRFRPEGEVKLVVIDVPPL